MIGDLLRGPSLPPSPGQLKIRRPSYRKKIIAIAGGFSLFLLLAATSYVFALSPVDRSATTFVRIVVPEGATAADIGRLLEEHHLIRNRMAFEIYTLLTGTKSSLRAGGHALKKSQSVAEIVAGLVDGSTDKYSVIILPGLTLEQLADPTIRGSLADQGFTPNEVKTAFAASYVSTIFTDKPAGTSLEGYIHPDTYGISTADPLEAVLKMSFREMERVVAEGKFEQRLQAQGLTLRQGIILASIVQKEVSDPKVQPQVAQVFLKRLRDNIALGSDVTFLYIAAKEGRTPSVNDPSPYNTRRVKGLPPGPISNFNLSALEAVAAPAAGDYVYFVAGDDGTTHFARTEAEHNANIAAYCKKLCHQ